MTWFFLFLGIVATECLIELWSKGKVFSGVRSFLYSKFPDGKFIGALIRCPYCLSFWAGGLIIVLFYFAKPVWIPFVAWLTIVRCSNILNDIGDKIFYGQYGTIPEEPDDE